MDRRRKRTTELCQLCGTRPATLHRRGQGRGLRVCASCSLKVMPGVISDALLEAGVHPAAIQAFGQALEAIFGPYLSAPPAQSAPAALESILAPYVAQHRAEAMKNRLYEQGNQAGQEWAQRAATFEELGAIRKFYEEIGGLWQYPLDADVGGEGPSGAELFHALIRPNDQSAGAAEAFWQGALADNERGEEHHGSYVLGFSEGALAVALVESRFGGGRADDRNHGDGTRAAVGACTL